jgi:hypothetical protein
MKATKPIILAALVVGFFVSDSYVGHMDEERKWV